MVNDSSSNSRPLIAVVGAGGFVGARLVQLAALSGNFQTVPILRSFKGLARLGAAVPQARIIDTKNPDELAQAFQGAQTVVNLTMGDQLRIVEDTQVMHHACLKAGVRQFIHLSSAVVFGRVTDASIHDDSPPDTKSWMLYARGKAKAEVWLRSCIRKDSLSIVVLRPGLIWGPGSNWSEMVGDHLLHGNAVLSNEGKGIANLIFVDNLARIILSIASQPKRPSGFYNIADEGTITWKYYYSEIGKRLGYPPESVCLWPDSRLRVRPQHTIEWALERPVLFRMAKWAFKRLGPGAKAVIKAKLKASPEPPSTRVPGGPPRLSRGHWVLHNTVHRLPTEKLHRDYGPLNLIPFEEALSITTEWLKFAGFRSPAVSLNS